MFIFNIKVNGKLCFRIIMIVMALIVLAILGLSVYKLFLAQNEEIKVNDEMIHSNVTEIEPNNYTNILKAVHEDIDSYIGKEIKFSGYVYRVIDFKDNQFVLARDMVIDSQSYVVGFLAEYDKISDYKTSAWVKITGTITKGKYHNKEIPIIRVNSLRETQKPEDSSVLPPSNTYIPTSALL